VKYVPTTTQANDVNGLRNWTVNELHRLASGLTNEDAASSGDLDAEIAAREAADTALAAQIEDLYVSTDGSNRTYAQTSAPSSPNIGDLWFDTDNNNIPSRWSGTAWAAVDDARIVANATAIAAEITARQAADTTLTAAVNSLGGRATNLEATVNSATDGNLALKARVLTEETARASGDTALATRATALEATVNNATTGVTATAARLTTEETARATADSALASRATTLEATVNSATDGNVALKARIATEESARASGDTAIASSVTSLTATVNNNNSTLNAAVNAEQAARASADSALASRASSLEATVNSATDGNLALKARISTEETARATADSALAIRATSLEATVNGQSASITTLQSTSASLQGDVTNLNAQYGVTVSAGKVTGFKLNSSATTSDFIVQADRFKIENASGAPFEVIGGTTYIKEAMINTLNADKITTGTLSASRLILDGLSLVNSGGTLRVGDAGVNTVNISANAVTRTAAAFISTVTIPPSNGDWATVGSVTLTVDAGSTIRLDASTFCTVDSSAADPAFIEGRWVRGGSVIRAVTLMEAVPTSGVVEINGQFGYASLPARQTGNPTVIALDTAPSAGSTTWTFQVRRSGSAFTSNTTLIATEIRR